jgi:predicted ester cyclase
VVLPTLPTPDAAMLADINRHQRRCVMSSSEDRMKTVRDCFAEATAGNWAALPGIVTDDYVCHPEEVRGPEGLAELIAGYRAAIAGLNVTIDHQFADGDFVATRGTVRGRHAGELMGVAATGRDVAFTTLTISRFRDGRIAEEWELVDVPSLLAQLGPVAPG